MEFLNFYSTELLKNHGAKAMQSQAIQYTELPRSFSRHAKNKRDEARQVKAFEGLLNRYFKK